jgi:hypothetical protein
MSSSQRNTRQVRNNQRPVQQDEETSIDPSYFIPRHLFGPSTPNQGEFKCLHRCGCSKPDDWTVQEKSVVVKHICDLNQHEECNNYCPMFK